MRILVVDDDACQRRLMRTLLGEYGMSDTAEAADGGEALDFLSRVSVDLVLTDLQMPRMDGLTMVRRLRGLGSQLPIIMLSAMEDPSAAQYAFAAGADDFMSKPVNGDELAQKIARLLTLRPAA
jgi:CheY-like chemotaxis protein